MRPLAGHELVVDDLPEQGVTEREVRIVLSTGRHEDPPFDDLAEGCSHLRCREVQTATSNSSSTSFRPPTRREGPPGRRLRRQPGARERHPQARRDSVGAGLARRCDHLLGVERVPAGPLEGPVDQSGVRGVTELIREQPSQFVTIEPREVDAIDALVALELGQERQECTARIDLVGPDGGESRSVHLAGCTPGTTAVARRLVGPLEVLDHQEDWAESGDPFEDPKDELEQADLGKSLVRWRTIPIGRIGRRRRVLPVRSAANLGHQPREFASTRSEERRQGRRIDIPDERTERLDERPVGKPPGPEREAPAAEDAGAGAADLIGECRHQSRLADPRLAADDHDPRLAGGGARVGAGEAAEFRLAPDEGLPTSTVHDAAMIGAPVSAPSRSAIDEFKAQAHAVMPASSSLVRRRPRARHRRVRVACPVQPMIPAISAVR